MKKPFLKVIIITHNEEIMLPFILDHYERLFTDVQFKIYDNLSTDKTVEIATERGCEVVSFQSGGMSDTVQAILKSKEAVINDATWKFLIDCDEAIYITQEELKNLDATLIKFKGWELFDFVSSPYKANCMGCESSGYSKPVGVKCGVFSEIKFAPGAHSILSIKAAEPDDIRWSKDEFNLIHFKHWSFDYSYHRSVYLAGRQSADNLKHRYSYHFSLPFETHLSYYTGGMYNKIDIPEPRFKHYTTESK